MLALVALLPVISACGGGGSGDVSQPKPAKVCSGPVIVQAFGDSTQEQQGNYLQLALDIALGPGFALVENHGVSGTTAAEFPAAKVKPGAVTLANYGINDSRAPGASVAAYKANLRKIAPTMFQTPSPPHDSYAQAMREVAAELGRPVIDVSAKVRAIPGWEGRIWDGVHPDPGLYWIVSSQIVAPAVAEVVRKAQCLP